MPARCRESADGLWSPVGDERGLHMVRLDLAAHHLPVISNLPNFLAAARDAAGAFLENRPLRILTTSCAKIW
jgi:hypothetical protein